MTTQELIDRAVVQAKVGLDPQFVGTRFELVANSLLSQVFEDATKELSAQGRSLPKLTKTLTFTNGVATLSSDVLTGLVSDSFIYDADDTTKIYVYVADWDDFIRSHDRRLGYFTIRNGTTIYIIEPDEEYVQGDGIDDTRTLVITGVPVIPAAASTIDAPAEFTNKALDLLVERLRGMVTDAD